MGDFVRRRGVRRSCAPNLALVRRLDGHFEQSESLYKRALAAEQAKFGEDHPEISTTLMGLAALYRVQGYRDKAVETDRRALALVEKTVGDKDPLAAEIRARLTEAAGEYQFLLVRTKQEADDLRQRIGAGD